MDFPLPEVSDLANSFPYFIYQRVATTGPEGYFYQTIDFGYWYFLRKIITRWPEIDAAGANFAPDIRVEILDRGIGKRIQSEPIPFRLFSTPNSAGLQINAGGLVGASQPSAEKLINTFYPNGIQLAFSITGQNTVLPLPPWVDVCLLGYNVIQRGSSMGVKK
jgi:hypothetical protein